MNVDHAVFDPAWFDQIEQCIRSYGIKRTEAALREQGYQPSFIKAAIKKIIRHRGW